MDTEPVQLARHRDERMVDWHDGSFRELAEFLFRRLEEALRDLFGPYIRLTYAAHGQVRPGFDARDVLGNGDKAIYDCKLSLGGYPDSQAFLVFDADTAVAWNSGRPLFCEEKRTSRVRQAVESHASGYENPEEVVRWIYGNREQLSSVEMAVLEDQVVDWVLERTKVLDEQIPFDEMMKPPGSAAAPAKEDEA